MSAPYIDDAFINQYNRDLHHEYQLQSSLLRSAVRTDGMVNGTLIRFQKIGALRMGSKGRNGEIPITNPAHNHADATMLDRYVRTTIDVLDTRKMNVDARAGYLQSMALSGAYETDQIIINAMSSGATNYTGTYAINLTRATCLYASEFLDGRKVPRDGMRFCAVTPHQFSALMTIDEFKRSDYVGPDDLPYKRVGDQIRTWNGIHWMVHPDLPGAGTATAKCYAWHRSAVGHGIASEFSTMWVPSAAVHGWDCSASLSMGATVIDVNGILEIRVDDTYALTA